MNMSNQRVDRWSVAHSYKRLCDAGLAEPLTSRDGEVYILKADADYTPCYWLPSSDSYMRPGLTSGSDYVMPSIR